MQDVSSAALMAISNDRDLPYFDYIKLIIDMYYRYDRY